MRKLWTHAEIAAPAEVVWQLLTDTDRWPQWGPSIRRAQVNGGSLKRGATGTVTIVIGVDVPFEITDLVAGERWSWKVAGIGATDHVVEKIDSQRCRVGFGVPLVAAPYLAVCRLALHRIDRLATAGSDRPPSRSS